MVAVASPQESRLRARREAEAVYRQLNVSSSLKDSSANLLIYLPFKRSTGDARLQDPFEVFAVAGTTFGDTESATYKESYKKSARRLCFQHDFAKTEQEETTCGYQTNS